MLEDPFEYQSWLNNCMASVQMSLEFPWGVKLFCKRILDVFIFTQLQALKALDSRSSECPTQCVGRESHIALFTMAWMWEWSYQTFTVIPLWHQQKKSFVCFTNWQIPVVWTNQSRYIRVPYLVMSSQKQWNRRTFHSVTLTMHIGKLAVYVPKAWKFVFDCLCVSPLFFLVFLGNC